MTRGFAGLQLDLSGVLDKRPLPLTGELDDDPLGNRRAQRHATSQLSAGNRLGKGEHHEDPALLILRRRQPFLQLQRDPPACAIEPFDDAALQIAVRSEEHTSELQSLMRISYAVFCLKKK